MIQERTGMKSIDRRLLQWAVVDLPSEKFFRKHLVELVHSTQCIAAVPAMIFTNKQPGNMQRSNSYQQNVAMGW